MDEITALQNKYYENEQEIKRLTKENQQIETEAITLKDGVSVGTIVKDGDKTFRVISIMSTYGKFSKPWVMGNTKKKDGTYSNVGRHLYTKWELA